MAKRTLTLNNFSAGEVSPKMYGRVDTSYYAAGAKTINNFQPMITGGITRRVGTFQHYADFNASYPPYRLIPFTFNNDQSYIICISNEIAEWVILRSDGSVAATLDASAAFPEITINATVAADIRYAQSYDTLILTSRYFYPKRLIRNSDTSWEISNVSFTVPPTTETEGYFVNSTIELNSTAIGDVTTTSTGAEFFAADVGRTITQYYPETDFTVISADTAADTVTFNASIPAYTKMVFSGNDLPSPIVAGTSYWSDSTANASTKIYPTLADAIANTNALNIADVGTGLSTMEIQSGGSGQIKTVTTNDVVSLSIVETFSTSKLYYGYYKLGGTPATNIKLTQRDFSNNFEPSKNKKGLIVPLCTPTSSPAFRSSDVGKYIVCNTGGTFEILSVQSETQITVRIVEKQREGSVKYAGEWTLEERIWNRTTDAEYDADDDASSYPLCCAFFDQRLYLGSWAANPQGIVGSKTGDYYNFGRGTEDEDAFNFTVTSSQRIAHIVPVDPMLILADGSEMTVQGTDGLITPTSIQIKTRSYNGSSEITPVNVSGSACYVSPSKRRLYLTTFNEDTGRYSVKNLLKLSDHITKDAYITSITFQPEPDPVITCVLSDGTIATCIYSEEDEVMGWAKYELANDTDSTQITNRAQANIVAAIPNGADYKVFYLAEFDDARQRVIAADFSGRVGSTTNPLCLTDFSVLIPAGTYISRDDVEAAAVTEYSDLTTYDNLWSNVVLHLKFNEVVGSSYFVDSSNTPHVVGAILSPHGATSSNVPIIYDTSAYFDGEDTYPDGRSVVTVSNLGPDNIHLGTSDFSIDGWFRLAALPNTGEATGYRLIGQGTSNFDNLSWSVGIGHTGGQQNISLFWSTDGTNSSSIISDPISLNTDENYFFEVTRSAGTVYIFLNGVLLKTGTCTDDIPHNVVGTAYSTPTLTVGAGYRSVDTGGAQEGTFNTVHGYLQDIRVTIGAARHTTNYDISTTPAPSSAPPANSSYITSAYDDNAVLYTANTYYGKLSELQFPMTLSEAAIIGYNYKSEFELLTPEADFGEGTSQLSHLKSDLLGFRIYDSMDFKVNGDYISRSATNISWNDAYNTAMTTDLQMSNYGWNVGEHSLSVVQDLPVPLTISAIFMRLTHNIG